jgi:hypothetical protein
MVRVRRRYAMQMDFSPLLPALKGRTIFRGRYAAKKYAAAGVSPHLNSQSCITPKSIATTFYNLDYQAGMHFRRIGG